MLRASVCSVVALAFLAVAVMAADARKDQKEKNDKNKDRVTRATVTKVDARKGTLTLRMKDRNGKAVEKTFTLREDIRMLDSTGKVVAIDVFQSGNDVLVFEREGKIKQIKKADKNTKANTDKNKKGIDQKPPEKRLKDK